MSKLITVIVAAMFAAVSASAFAASHAGAKGDKMEKTEAKKWRGEERPSQEEQTEGARRKPKTRSNSLSQQRKRQADPAFFSPWSERQRRSAFVVPLDGLEHPSTGAKSSVSSFAPSCGRMSRFAASSSTRS